MCFIIRITYGGDSNEYTQYAIFSIEKKITLNFPKSAAMGVFSKGLKNEFETAVINEYSVFELLKFYWIFYDVGRYFETSVFELSRVDCTDRIYSAIRQGFSPSRMTTYNLISPMLLWL